ncbi:MAG: hypothetical protein KGZ71_05860, partial [Desulfobulbaceae bacterium]|nr:hypothetical protein [Desulfobulbaceae bacterium]
MKNILIMLCSFTFGILYNHTLFAQLSQVNDGSYDVSPINGFMSYTYPISNTTIDGYPIKVDVNYVSNATYVAYLRHIIDSVGNDGWIKLTKSTPTWVISVNGFVIQALYKTNRFHSYYKGMSIIGFNGNDFNDIGRCISVAVDEPCRHEWDIVNQNQNIYLPNESQLLWILEGYNVCNNVETPDNIHFQDFIKILREDGSLLELRNASFNKGANDVATYTGLYYDNSVNTNGFAIVEYDDSKYWPEYIRNQYILGEGNLPQKPRIVKYYPGDGLEYVFREYVAPFGLREDSQRKGTKDFLGEEVECIENCGKIPKATIFYLEELNSSQRNLTTFKRDNHNQSNDAPFEILRGRANVIEFANHLISYSNSEIIISSFGKDYTLAIEQRNMTHHLPWENYSDTDWFINMKALGNIQKGSMDAKKNNYGFNTYEIRNSLGLELERVYGGIFDDEDLARGNYYVTEILDPEKRRIQFDYENKFYKLTDIPNGYNLGETNLRLYNYRLKQIFIEPTNTSGTPDTLATKNIKFVYKEDEGIAAKKYSFDSEGGLDPDQFNVVNEVYENTYGGRFYKSYNISSPSTSVDLFGNDVNIFRKSEITQINLNSGETTETHFYFSQDTINPIRKNIQQDYFSPPLHFTQPFMVKTISGDEIVTTKTLYKNEIGEGLIRVWRRCYWYPIREETKIQKGSSPEFTLRQTTYEYEFEEMGNFDGDLATMDGKGTHSLDLKVEQAYDWAVYKKIIRDYRPDAEYDNGFDNADLLVKTEINYLNLNFLYDVDIYRYEANYDKTTSDFNTMKNFHFGLSYANITMPTSYVEKTINVPHIIGLQTEVINFDKNDVIISAVKNVYHEDFEEGPTEPEYRRGSIKESYHKVKNGNYILSKEYAYEGGWERNMLNEVKGIFDKKSRTIYRYNDLPNISDQTPFLGKIMKNNQNVDYKSLTQQYYQFEAPIATENYLRKYKIIDNEIELVTDTLRTVYDKNNYGQITGVIDHNGWYFQTLFDNVGRKILERHPYDFPSNSKQGEPHTLREIDCVPITKSYLTEKITHVTTHIGASGGYQQYSTQPVITETFKNLHIGNTTKLMSVTTSDSLTFQQNYKVSEKSLQLVYEPSQYDSFHQDYDIESVNLKLMLRDYRNECVSINVNVGESIYETNIIAGCHPISVLDNACDEEPSQYIFPVVYIDLTSIKSLFIDANTPITITITSNNRNGGDIRFPNLDGSDYSPCLEVEYDKSTNDEDDYTFKYIYDEKGRVFHAFSKVDDKVISTYDFPNKRYPNTYNDNFEKTYNELAGRYTATSSHYYTNGYISQKFPIGSPIAFQRIDSIRSKTGYLQQENYDQLGNKTVSELYEDGALKKVTFADNSTINYSYDFGSPYDILGISDEDYFGVCFVAISTNELGVRTAKYSDALGRMRRIVVDLDDEEITTDYVYDDIGRLIKIINPDGQETTYEHDDYGRIIEKVQTDLGSMRYKHDITGNLRFSQNDEQSVDDKFSFYQYDDLGRSVIVGEAKIPELNFQGLTPDNLNIPNHGNFLYTSNPTIWQKNGGNVNSILPDTNNLAFFAYNKIRQDNYLANLASPSMTDLFEGISGKYFMHSANYYSLIGMPETASTSNFEDISQFPEFVKVVVHHEELPTKVGHIWENMPSHEAINRLAPKGVLNNLKGRKAAVAYRDEASEPFHYVFFSYDARGRVEAIIRWTENIGFDVIHYTYNSMNKVNSVNVVDAIRQFTTWYVYDDNGRTWKVYSKVGPPGSGFVASGPNIDSVKYEDVVFPTPLPKPQSENPEIVYSYDKRNNIDTVKYPGADLIKLFVYDERNWVTDIVAKKGLSDIIFAQQLQRNESGNITNQTSTQNGQSTKSYQYTYDNLNRLTVWKNSVADPIETYNYDRLGNRTSVVVGTDTYAYTYFQDQNRLHEVTKGTDKTVFTYNTFGAVTEIKKFDGQLMTNHEEWEYANSTVPKRFTKHNIADQYLDVEYTGQNLPSYDPQKWLWQYRKGAFDTREQKRLLISPHGDGTDDNGDDYAHLWEYSLSGVAGELYVLYKGLQTATTTEPNENKTDAGRRVYISPFKYYSAGGELQFQADGTTKEVHITDNLGSVRSIVI